MLSLSIATKCGPATSRFCTLAKYRSLQSLLARQFNTTSILYARGERKIPTPTKKQLAAKARKRALKVRKHIYESEKMPFQDAIAVLQVRMWYFGCSTLMSPIGGRSSPSKCDTGAHNKDRYAERNDDTQRPSDLASRGKIPVGRKSIGLRRRSSSGGCETSGGSHCRRT